MKQIEYLNRVFVFGINHTLGGKQPSKILNRIGDSNIVERFPKYINLVPKFNQFFSLTTTQYRIYQLIKNQIEQ